MPSRRKNDVTTFQDNGNHEANVIFNNGSLRRSAFHGGRE